MKILTAIGNPYLNEKLKSIDSLMVIGKDVQYQEAVIEILEENLDIDCLIINKELPGDIGFYKLINKIKNINMIPKGKWRITVKSRIRAKKGAGPQRKNNVTKNRNIGRPTARL